MIAVTIMVNKNLLFVLFVFKLFFFGQGKIKYLIAEAPSFTYSKNFLLADQLSLFALRLVEWRI